MTRDTSRRGRELGRLRRELERLHSPRLHMSLIVALTGAAGFLASVGLLALGVEPMWLRYPAALVVAYLVFLFLLWVWLHIRDDFSFELPADVGGGSSGGGWRGLGGRSGGGGASQSWAEGGAPVSSRGDATSMFGDMGDLGDVGDASGLDELAVVLVVIAVLFGGLLLAASLVSSAPVLLAEITLDAAVSAGLYKRLRVTEGRSWVHSAIRRTWAPFTAFAVLLAVAGAAMQLYAPEAQSIGPVLDKLTSEQPASAPASARP